VETIAAITRSEAEGLARTEYARVADQLRSLAADDWTKPTDCPLWDVRAIAGHTLGMLSTFTGVRRLIGEMRAAQKAATQNGGPLVDSLTARQVAANADLSTEELIAAIDALGPQAAVWRAQAPRPLRWMPMRQEVGGAPETWRMAYLLDVILTRDAWMHRVDIARATHQQMVLTPDHDGRIVTDVVAEWARRHGQAFTLSLTGPAGGTFVAGDGTGEAITIDAVEFCRTLSGRTEAVGLLSQEVPF
jgi:uncharacterized protein (TIGR03083 family)